MLEGERSAGKDQTRRWAQVGLLDGKVALITGGAMGMGAATAELFAAEGAKVVIADLNEELGRRQAQKIAGAGGACAFVKADVSKAADVEAMVQFVVDTYGRLDVALNNAARSPRSEEHTSELQSRENLVC